MARKVCIIGLDCAAPELVFRRWVTDLPNLRRVMQAGIYGPLESCIPAITVPAWMCMMTGRDPGSLGIYGFRDRSDYGYGHAAFASSDLVRHPTIWDLLGARGKQTVALGVPLTYPPRAIEGSLVSCFMAPGTEVNYTYPAALKDEIRQVVGEYMLDVRPFRTDDKDGLLAGIRTMTERRFRLAAHLLTTRPWDLFVMVEIGTDRIHHGFWSCSDPQHRRYVAGNRFEDAIRDYYIAVDRQIGALMRLLPPDTALLVVSDHGAKRMDGGVCLNEWLISEGYLKLLKRPDGIQPLTPDMVDWRATRAWGDGGYCGRVHLNVRGREPEGIVPPGEVHAVRARLAAGLETVTDEEGRALGTRVFAPEQLYAECHNIPPDLIVYFGDLYWRAIGSVGHGSIWSRENDLGPDDANHAQHGIFMMAEAAALRDGGPPPTGEPHANRRDGLSIYDVAPTVLRELGVPPAEGMSRGPIDLGRAAPARAAYTIEEEAELARRMEELGYV